MKIISADERLREKAGAKILIAGPPKIGKTSLLRTLLNSSTALFIDLEAGDQAVMDVPIATLRPQTWDDCRNLACFLTGPNPALPPTACYSEAHYDAIRADFDGMGLERIDTYFVDSITVAARLSFGWAEQQPEAVSERTRKKDIRGAYGLHAREMIGWLTHLQHGRGKNVIFVCILESVVDEFRHREWALQIEGQKTARELPGIVDQIVAMNFVDLGDGQEPVRAFVCGPNPWGFPAGDRSGKLDLLEKPHLGELLAKLSAPIARKALTYTTPQTTTEKQS
jgi:hypothetical protein